MPILPCPVLVNGDIPARLERVAIPPAPVSEPGGGVTYSSAFAGADTLLLIDDPFQLASGKVRVNAGGHMGTFVVRAAAVGGAIGSVNWD